MVFVGVEWIMVWLIYDKVDWMVVDLGLWDLDCFCGWSGGMCDWMMIFVIDVLLGYLLGLLLVGLWKVVLGVLNICVGMYGWYCVDIWFDCGKYWGVVVVIVDLLLWVGLGWYCGDFYMYDVNSDGLCMLCGWFDVVCVLCLLFCIVEVVVVVGFDFIVVSDYNIVLYFDGLWEF